MRTAPVQRQKLSATGGIASRKARPITQLPAQKSEASVSSRKGRRRAAPELRAGAPAATPGDFIREACRRSSAEAIRRVNACDATKLAHAETEPHPAVHQARRCQLQPAGR